jgi:hypothetical protein
LEVRKMLGIPIPPIDPATLGGGSLLVGVIATAALIVVFAVATWVYFRRQPAAPDIRVFREDDVQPPKAA